MLSNKGASPILLAGLCGAALALSGCSKSMEQVVGAHRASVESAFARIRALDAKARATPPAGSEQMKVAAGQIVLDGGESKARNALFISASDLDAPEAASRDHTGALHAYTLQACGEALSGQATGVPAAYDSYLEECESAEYLFVLRVLEEESAQVAGRDSFRPGRFEGDVLLFHLADGVLLGSFPVSAKSSASVMALADAGGAATDVADRLESDLEANVFADLNAKLHRLVPGSIP
jgi:hypothetical protein